MARDYLSGDRGQGFLLPPDMASWLPVDHLVWFVLDAVGRLDLSGFEDPVGDPRGRRRYDPAVLVTLVVYAYCVGERSSRRIERRCWEDVAFRVAAADLKPDHTTISRFLKDHSEAFDTLFVQVLALAARMGLGRVGTVVIDGTKVAADASPLAARTRRGLEEQVRAITGEARRVDAAEDEMYGDATGEELPPELVEPGSRRARLEEALAELEAEEANDAARPPSRRRKKPAKVNVTDPQSRVVKGPRGYFPGYNAQAVVDGDGLIVGADVTNDQADNHQFGPMVDQACKNLDAAGLDRPQRVVADNGYWTNDNATGHRDPPDPHDGPPRPEPFIAPPTDPRRRPLAPRGPIPRDATPAQIMERKLATKTGAAVYATRGATIEPVFGTIKWTRGINRFRRRGLLAARHEWRLAAMTHNILKLWRHTLAATAVAA